MADMKLSRRFAYAICGWFMLFAAVMQAASLYLRFEWIGVVGLVSNLFAATMFAIVWRRESSQ
jgi:hypothetical protein